MRLIIVKLLKYENFFFRYRFQCIYCEKFFTDRLVLREHMRKKMHKRINPGNHLFDQYYSVNYLEMGKNWMQVAVSVMTKISVIAALT